MEAARTRTGRSVYSFHQGPGQHSDESLMTANLVTVLAWFYPTLVTRQIEQLCGYISTRIHLRKLLTSKRNKTQIKPLHKENQNRTIATTTTNTRIHKSTKKQTNKQQGDLDDARDITAV